MLFGETLHCRYERFRHWVHQSGGGEFVTAVTAEKLRDSALTLEPRHVDLEVHPVDALQLKGQMVIQYLGDAVVRSFSAPVRLRSFGIDCRLGG
jgi:hypothetical protein